MNRTLIRWAGRFFLLTLLLVPLLESSAQDRYAQVAVRYDRPSVFHEAIVLPVATQEARAQAIVAFRIPNSLLVFVHESDGFVTDAEVAVELYRGNEKIDETIWRGRMRAATFEETTSDTSDLAGRVRFAVGPGTYAYRISFAGTRSAGSAVASRTFRVPDFTSDRIGSIFFVRRASVDGDSIGLMPLSLGGDAPFGEAALVAVPLAAFSESARLEYRLYRVAEGGLRGMSPRGTRSADEPAIEPPSGEDVLLLEDAADLSAAMPLGGRVEPDCFCWRPDDSAVKIATLDLGTDTLQNGTYLLEVQLHDDGGTHTRRTRFNTHWRAMPLSLYDVEVAIRNLSFIEGRDRIRSMLRGSRQDQIAAFRSYWNQRDPSPGTVVNELMQEYYERIDYAASEFRTGRTPLPDGLRTDAARIYVIHGPPDEISSSFPSSGGVQQVWTYPDGRRFVFWAASSLEPLVLEETSSSNPREEDSGS